MAIITEEVGNIFSAPANSILIQPCNARGVMGSGVALAFKQHYPHAFRKYNAHCLSPPTDSKLSIKQHQANLVGTALLIPPTPEQQAAKTSHHIACLFTSLDYGKRVSPAEIVLKNTRSAIKDLARQVGERKELGEDVGKCYAVRINSGKFNVAWQETKAVLEAGELDMTVVSLESGEGADGADIAADGKLGEKPPPAINATGASPRASVRAKAESAFKKQKHGGKRKVEKDLGFSRGDDREDAEKKEPVHIHPGIAKRRKKLELEG